MKNVLLSLLLLWQSSNISSGQAGLPLIPKTDSSTIKVLKQESAVTKDTIADLLKKVEKKVDMLQKEGVKKPATRYRYIRTKQAIQRCVDTLWLPFPQDSVDLIINELKAQLKPDTVYIAIGDTVKKKKWWSRIF